MRNWGGARFLHDIRYPKDREGEPCQRLTPSLGGRRLDTSPVNRTEDEEAVLVGCLLHQLDPVGCNHLAGIRRTLERFAADGVGSKVEAQGFFVAFDGSNEENREVLFALTRSDQLHWGGPLCEFERREAIVTRVPLRTSCRDRLGTLGIHSNAWIARFRASSGTVNRPNSSRSTSCEASKSAPTVTRLSRSE
jgi:hypothetical protein